MLAVLAVGAVAVSGGSGADPRTPAGLAGMPPPFLGTAVAGGGEATAAVDAYGDVVDLRPAPAGPALIENPLDRQAGGTVDVEAGIVPGVRVGGGAVRYFWQAGAVAQRYLPGTNLVWTAARFGRVSGVVTVAAAGDLLAVRVRVRGPGAEPTIRVPVDSGLRCRRERRPRRLDLVCGMGGVPDAPGSRAEGVLRSAAAADRAWLEGARPLGRGAPAWAVAMYERSLLTLRALTDSRSGAAAAGERDGWAYVWPRDAGTTALALATAGYRAEARRVARFLLRVDLEAAARFHGDGSPVPGRASQGDALGWTAAAATAAGLTPSAEGDARIVSPTNPVRWRERADYQEGEPGDYLANAIASGADVSEFSIPMRPEDSDTPGEGRDRGGLVRRGGDPDSGLDSAAAWAVRPFAFPAIYPRVRATLVALLGEATPYGITPGEGWHGGEDPWLAPTAWSAWAFAALARAPGSPDPATDRRRALRLLAALRRAATPAGALPERVDAGTGVPRSTTPLAWPHAFALLTLRELWPGASGPGGRGGPSG